MKNWAVCQKCGVGLPIAEAKSNNWLIDTYRKDPTLMVVRCPAHITEWALRQSGNGRRAGARIKNQRARRREARAAGPPDRNVWVDPFPQQDEP